MSDTLHYDDESEPDVITWTEGDDPRCLPKTAVELMKRFTSVTTEKLPDGMYRHTLKFGHRARDFPNDP